MISFEKWRPYIPIVLAITLFAPTLTYDFVYDDHWTVDHNPHLTMWPGLDRVFASDIWGLTDYPAQSNYYRPMFFLANWLTAHLLSPSPWAFHLVNVLLHAAVVALVWLVSMNVFFDRRIAFIASTLFAVHPIHIEAVAWISDIVDLGCTAFFMLALFFYVRPTRRPLIAQTAMAMSYLISLLWKETGATFLPVVVAYDLVVLRKLQWRRYVPPLLVTAIYFLLRYRALGGVVPLSYHTDLTPTSYPIVAVAGLGTYILKLFFPYRLSIYYAPVTASIAYAMVPVAVVLTALILWRNNRRLSWTLLWIVLALSPALAVSRISMPISERNLYLSSIGFCLTIALIVSTLKWRYATVLPTALAGIFVLGTIARLPDWRDDLRLYEVTLKQHSDASIIRMNLATELTRRGRLPEAIEQVNVVLASNPSDIGVLTNMAMLKSRQDDWKSVREICSRALTLDPKLSSCLTLLASADQRSGDLNAALQKLDAAVRVAPHSYEAHYYRGNIYAQMGRLDDALLEFQRCLTARPTAEAFNNLASTYFQMKRLDDAIEAYQTALKLDPEYSLATDNLDALLKWRNGHPSEGSPHR